MNDVIYYDFTTKQRRRNPLYIDYLCGKVTGGQGHDTTDTNLDARLIRIRASLNKLNDLMAELREQADKDRRNK